MPQGPSVNILLCVCLSLLALVRLMGWSIPNKEYDALKDLYTDTDGESWEWRAESVAGQKWNFTDGSDPCVDVWQGLTCTSFTANSNNHVQVLNLTAYGLTGTLPDSLGNLTNLHTLTLNGNSLRGPIPLTIGDMIVDLMHINLEHNKLSGLLPGTLGSLANLAEMKLSWNALSGPIPHSYGALPSLQVMEISGNQLYGPLIPQLGNLDRLVTLRLDQNALSDSIPESFGALANLHDLDLAGNKLKGTLPDSLGQLSQLQVLRLDLNLIGGTIPITWSNLANLTVLNLSRNRIKGPIPDFIGTLSRISDLELWDNKFNGTIPRTLVDLRSLEILNLARNHLTGTIPPAIGDLPALRVFVLSGNHLTGPLSPISGSARSIEIVDVANNELSGSIPMSTGDLSKLSTVALYENKFSGSLPDFLCALTGLKLMYLDTNDFTGQIPACIHFIANASLMTFSNNRFTGSVPSTLSQLSKLEVVWLNVNYFTGPVPDLSALNRLNQLLINNNYFTGPVPAEFSNPKNIEIVLLADNYLTGTIPATYGQFPALKIFSAANNYLTGCIPTTFSALPNMLEFYVHTNYLGCTLNDVFNSTAQRQLAVVEVSNNHITGSLPPEIFRLPQLSTFTALSNCITGTLPPEVCHSTTLQSLILDGLHTAPTCRYSILRAAHSYYVPNGFHGTIPACVFLMPSLASLHLSGNDLTGTIPQYVNISTHLLDLILSHNALRGTVPDAVQSHNWRYLDLSFNKLNGVLQSTFGEALTTTSEKFHNITVTVKQNSVVLENNRLSGHVPSPLLHMLNVSVLGSNVFGCRVDKSDLPHHDHDRESYQCGSNAFNAPFYAFLIVAVLIGAVVCVQYRYPGVVGMLTEAARWRLDPQQTPRNMSYVITALTILSQISLICTALIVVVLVPWYVAASNVYGTYDHSYAWVVSAAFMSGSAPMTAEFILYICLMVALVIVTGLLIIRKDREERLRPWTSARISQSSVAPQQPMAQLPYWQRGLVYLTFLAINVFVVVGVNLGFVTIALTQSNGVLFIAQLLLSLFKLSWNTVCTPFLIYLATGYISQSRASATFVTVQVYIGLFNNIAIPCLVVAVLSPGCFYSVFDTPDPVDSTVLVQNCKVAPEYVDCEFAQPLLLTTSYNPPFRYDYQCSSSFITYYAPAFVYLGIAAGILTPIAKLVGVYLFTHSGERSLTRKLLKKVMPRLLKPIKAKYLLRPSTVERNSTASQRDTEHRTSRLSLAHIAEKASSLWANYRPYFDANNLIITIIIYLGILLTYGVVFPPLAVVMCVTILSVVWQAQISLGRFVQRARDSNALHMVELIEQECKGAISIEKLRRSMFAIICYSCTFYALFLFDTLGDAVGFIKAYWVLIVMPLVPLLMYLLVRVHRAWQGEAGPIMGMSIDVGVFELSLVRMTKSATADDSSSGVKLGEQNSNGGDITSRLSDEENQENGAHSRSNGGGGGGGGGGGSGGGSGSGSGGGGGDSSGQNGTNGDGEVNTSVLDSSSVDSNDGQGAGVVLNVLQRGQRASLVDRQSRQVQWAPDVNSEVDLQPGPGDDQL